MSSDACALLFFALDYVQRQRSPFACSLSTVLQIAWHPEYTQFGTYGMKPWVGQGYVL